MFDVDAAATGKLPLAASSIANAGQAVPDKNTAAQKPASFGNAPITPSDNRVPSQHVRRRLFASQTTKEIMASAFLLKTQKPAFLKECRLDTSAVQITPSLH